MKVERQNDNNTKSKENKYIFIAKAIVLSGTQVKKHNYILK